MKSAIVKRSVVLDGRKTSVSLENEFWDGLREIADGHKTNLSAMVQRINDARANGNLSSSIRVYVFNHFRTQAVGPTPLPHQHAPEMRTDGQPAVR